MDSNRLRFRDGFIDGIPIILGYIPVGLAFGILSKSTGITWLETLMFCIFVFAGASQFMALNLIAMGTGIGQIIITTLLVNFRHFLMGASLVARMDKKVKKWSPIISFGISDEVFSIASFKEGKLTTGYMIGLELAAYSSWAISSVIGYIVGGILPLVVKTSMGIALYALFVALIIPEGKKSIRLIYLALLSGCINWLVGKYINLPNGWSIIVAVIIVSLIGTYFMDEKEVVENE
ncbi:MAG: AzlC family ABC transporter permease [Firmicutes bacterium]|nr:AzlC family ABC transporter permease [Bacillota bacterium]